MDTKLITIGEYLIREEADILVKMLSLDDIQATVGTHTPPNIYGQGLYYCIMVSPLDVEKADKIYQNFKKRKFEQEMSSIDENIDLGDYDNEIYSTTKNAREYILKMVDKLPVRNALVIILFYINDMSLKDISQVMDISLVNARVLLHRSRNSLRDLLLKHNYREVI